MNTLQEELTNESMEVESSSPETTQKKTRNQWNWVQVSGRISSGVERKIIREQTVIQFTLIFESLRKTDKEGSHVNFIDVELWGKRAELFYTLIGKGMEIIISGELFQQRWISKDGKKTQKFCISADALAISDQTFKGN
ncbi:MAG TPA: single-stranded DNA-binding protein [Turneriella sp.]|nr:single-stranded DNA-binding protein [Turneriella sp.]